MDPKKKPSRGKATTRTVKYNGESWKLPIIGPGRSIEEKDRLLIATAVCAHYSASRLPLAECLKRCGVKSDSTWSKWTRESKEIADLYESSRLDRWESQKLTYIEAARSALLDHIKGYTRKTREVILEPIVGNVAVTVETDIGAVQMRIVGVKEKEFFVRPSLEAAKFALTNVDGKNFTKNPAPHVAGNTAYPTELEIIVNDYASASPVTDESDIKDIVPDGGSTTHDTGFSLELPE